VEMGYARQSINTGTTSTVVEAADDLKMDVTLRPSSTQGASGFRPFVRGLFDTEFTPTVDATTGAKNPRQLALRGSGGMLLIPGSMWQRFELAVAVENDFGSPNLQYGFQARADLVKRFGSAQVTYRLSNDVTYFFPSHRDTERNLALRYAMLHELSIPLVDELSLSISADVLFFKGKVPATHKPGVSLLLRVGLTYDRLWKPRYQPFF